VKIAGVVLIGLVLVLLAVYWIMDRGTQVTYESVSEETSDEFKKIYSIMQGKSCVYPLTQDYVSDLKHEFPEYLFSIKQGGLVVHGHYFSCKKENGSYVLVYVESKDAP